MPKRLDDLIIVGAGPAGLSAGIFASEMRLKTLLLEAEEPGGQLVSLYPFKLVSDYPGFPPCPAGELAAKVVDHAQSMGCRIMTARKVSRIFPQNGYFQVVTSQGDHHSKAVIVSVGLGVFAPRQLHLPGEVKFKGKGVCHLPPKTGLIKAKKVLVVGGGDTALETATQLAETNQVTLIHRRDQFRALEVNVNQAKRQKVRVMTNCELKAIIGNSHPSAVRIVNNLTNQEKELPVDTVFVLIGFELERNLLDRWGLEIENQAVKCDRHMQTSRPGIFACGDIATPVGDYKRIIVAEAQAACAVYGVCRYLKGGR